MQQTEKETEIIKEIIQKEIKWNEDEWVERPEIIKENQKRHIPMKPMEHQMMHNHIPCLFGFVELYLSLLKKIVCKSIIYMQKSTRTSFASFFSFLAFLLLFGFSVFSYLKFICCIFGCGAIKDQWNEKPKSISFGFVTRGHICCYLFALYFLAVVVVIIAICSRSIKWFF